MKGGSCGPAVGRVVPVGQLSINHTASVLTDEDITPEQSGGNPSGHLEMLMK